ncbi:hypothetical protein PI125_g12364 [Phytophthora idaei]|nr:hypothetical protein PI125_g12364 [Phytophthora idaei]
MTEIVDDVGELEFRPDCDEDVSPYVQVIRAERPPPDLTPKPGLMNGVTRDLPDGFGASDGDENDMFEVPRVVRNGRRVVSTVANFEALSGG